MLTARRPPSQVLVSARLWTVEQISYLCKMHQGIRKGLTAANQIPCCAECTQHKRNNTEKVTLFQQNSQRIPLQTCGLPICFLKKGHFFFFSYDFLGVCLQKKSEDNELKWKDFQDLPSDRTKLIQKQTLEFLLYSKFPLKEAPGSTCDSTEPRSAYQTTGDNPNTSQPKCYFSSISSPRITIC